jgi:hypothetical protein
VPPTSVAQRRPPLLDSTRDSRSLPPCFSPPF